MAVTTIVPSVIEVKGVPFLEFSSGAKCELPNHTAGILCARSWHLYEALADMLVMFAYGDGEMPPSLEAQRQTAIRARKLMDEITVVARRDQHARPLPGRLGLHG